MIIDKIKSVLRGTLFGIQNFFIRIKSGGKGIQILLGIILILVIAAVVFFLLQWYASSKKVFASTAAIKVELPSGIKGKDLQNLNDEQKKKLSEKIKDTLSKKTEEIAIGGFVIPQVIILTENNQPIIIENQTQSGSTPTPTPVPETPSPSPSQCSDTDNGINYSLKGTCNSPGVTETDLCISNQLLREWRCNEATYTEDGVSKTHTVCQSDNYQCPKGCRDGACVDEIVPKEFRIGTLFTTKGSWNGNLGGILGADSKCQSEARTANFAGKWIALLSTSSTYMKDRIPDVIYQNIIGSFIARNKDDLFDGSIQSPILHADASVPSGQLVWTGSDNEAKGKTYIGNGSIEQDTCADWTCILSQYGAPPICSSTAGYAIDLDKNWLTAYQRGCNNVFRLYCIKTDETGGEPPVPAGGNEIKFNISNDAKDAYYDENGSSLKDDIDKIYQKAKEIFGHPYKSIPVSIEVSNDGGYYNATLNKIVFEKDNPPSRLQLIWMILSAFHDDLIAFMPEIWEKGIIEVSAYEINRELFEPNHSYIGSQTSTYELLNNPAVSNDNGALSQGEVSGVLGTHNLMMTAWRKPFYEDKNFIANLNKAIYKLPVIDNTLKDKLPTVVVSVKSSIEGIPSSQWLPNQYILGFNAQAGKWIIAIVQKAANETNDVIVHLQAMEVSGNGNKEGKNSLDVQINALDLDGNQVWSSTAKTAKIDTFDGTVRLGTLPSAISNGCLRFTIGVAGFGSTEFYYPYKNNQAMAPGGTSANGVYGCVDQKNGKVIAKTGSGEQTADLAGGAFSFPALKDYQGSIELTFIPSTGSQTKKTVTKIAGDYYTFIKTGAPPVSRGGSREATPSGEEANEADGKCDTGNWIDYSNEKFGYKMKFPRDWGQDPSYSGQSSTFTRESLSSSQNPADLTDPQKKVSHIDLLVSAKDLKTDEDYGRWFEDGSGNQKKSTVAFKGVQAEKFINDTPMHAGDYHSEMYYFKKGDFYYLISIGIYITPDLKTKNEEILRCFLASFEFLAEKTYSDLIPCSKELLNTDSSDCALLSEETFCGYQRMVYDNGKEAVIMTSSRNPCMFCSYFVEDGSLERGGLRGTKIYVLGYKKGPCPEK